MKRLFLFLAAAAVAGTSWGWQLAGEVDGTNAWVVGSTQIWREETVGVAYDVDWHARADRDVWLAARRKVAFAGKAMQDARLAGTSVEATGGSVAGNLVAVGQGVTLGSGLSVAGDALVWASGEVLAEGTVGGEGWIHADEVVLGGRWDGNVKVAARKLRVKPGTVVAGRLVAEVDEPFVVGRDAQVGEVVRKGGGTGAPATWTARAKRQARAAAGVFLGTFLAGWLFARMFPMRAAMAAGNLSRSPMLSLLLGLVAGPAGLAVTVALAGTVVGAGAAALLAFVLLALGVAAVPVAALWLGRLALRGATAAKSMALGSAVVGLAWLAPGLWGAAVAMAFWSMGMGALAMTLFQRARMVAVPGPDAGGAQG